VDKDGYPLRENLLTRYRSRDSLSRVFVWGFISHTSMGRIWGRAVPTPMKREHLNELIATKRQWTEPLAPEEKAKGFRGWYSSNYLPHFDKPGLQQFITYRLADSLPASRRAEWETLLKVENDPERQRRLELYLDRSFGACHLRNPRVAEMVQENLWHFDGKSYRLLAWIIMPNHVHVVIEVWQVPLGEILKSWKSYTAKQANQILSRTGTFWEEDYFDRYVRDEKNFWQYVRYIENNPTKAHLARAPEDWLWSSARYRTKGHLSASTLIHPKQIAQEPGQPVSDAFARLTEA
jgi:putative transposase